jgi:hypothetical protein
VSKSIATEPITGAADIVAWLDETLRALRIDRAAMVGLSMGTWMATQAWGPFEAVLVLPRVWLLFTQLLD